MDILEDVFGPIEFSLVLLTPVLTATEDVTVEVAAGPLVTAAPELDIATARALLGTAEVTIAVPALSHGATTHCEASALSTYFPLFLVGVSLKTYKVEKAPAAQAM